MKRVYIAGPLTRGDFCGNLNAASDAFHALMRAGCAPLCPHWSAYSGYAYKTGPSGGVVVCEADPLPRDTGYEEWIRVCLPWVEAADAVLRLPGESPGADREVAHAHANGIPVFYGIDELLAWGDAKPEAA